jgi:hypothetical protein
MSGLNTSPSFELPAYQHIANALNLRNLWEVVVEEFLSFLATMLELIKSSLTWGRLTSIENWLAGGLLNLDTQAGLETTLATIKQQLVEETLGFFAELPMADSGMDE